MTFEGTSLKIGAKPIYCPTLSLPTRRLPSPPVRGGSARKTFAKGPRVDTGYGETGLEIGGHRDPLAAIQAELDALWSVHPNVPEHVRMQIAIAAGEVGANIVEHTGHGQPLGIRMRSQLVGDQVHVAFTDNGPPACIDLASVAMPDVMAERGRGLALAHAVLGQFAYCCDDLGNHWTLISHRFA